MLQNVLDTSDLSSASATALFFQLMGGAIWLSVSQSLFANKLIAKLMAIEGLNPAVIVAAGATDLRNVLSGVQLDEAIDSYMSGLKDAYALSIALGGTAWILAIVMIVFDRRRLSKGVVVVGAA